jgi:hypothetical protein
LEGAVVFGAELFALEGASVFGAELEGAVLAGIAVRWLLPALTASLEATFG